ncbi:hypothetical protein MSAN_02086500 [Mycena sanguinolenta]|uniref:F-box domain-containing protein n=1 Tax=Mycena sanguinolenta TaxID=230812 RepID=A0A8H6XGF4_9AGAR|nr:hypothetical protein MSAN_02086500 [Mycena sanguinolenta]
MVHSYQDCAFMRFYSSPNALHALPSHLLTSNDPPTDVEVVQVVRDVVDRLNASVVALDASIAGADAEHLLEQLRNMRKHAIEAIRRGRAILSVIRRLPSDILAEIFAYTVPDLVLRHRRVTDTSPWVYGRVCSRWRTLSTSLPTLWSHIEPYLPVPLLMTQLDLAKGCGLTIRLIYSETEAVDPLIACCRRWETVDIQMGVKTLAILERVHGKLPMLRDLKCSDSTGVGFCAAFEIAPNLSSATIVGKASLRLPWPQLARLSQRIPQIEGLSQLGSACNLVELSLTNSVPLSLALARTDGLSELILKFPLLRRLYIEDGEFLDFLVLPALEDLHISRHAMSLISLIDRSSCSLQKIISFDSEVDVIPIFVGAPTLHEIRLVVRSDPDLERLLSYLTIHSDSDIDFRPPCPELRAFAVYRDLNEHQSMLLAHMVESRLRSRACSNLIIV